MGARLMMDGSTVRLEVDAAMVHLDGERAELLLHDEALLRELHAALQRRLSTVRKGPPPLPPRSDPGLTALPKSVRPLAMPAGLASEARLTAFRAATTPFELPPTSRISEALEAAKRKAGP